eukprot:CCRYP_012153-RA/>CCRYP_012153-RA protein AED:0.22 eAED:0.22 QI:197/1/1/1/1/1/2/991/440
MSTTERISLLLKQEGIDPEHESQESITQARTGWMGIRPSCTTILFLACAIASVGLVTDIIHKRGRLLSESEIWNRVTLEGKSKKKKDVKIGHKKTEKYDCESDTNYSKHTVKTAFELPFAALFQDNKGQKKFEASSVTMVGDRVYAVCDSSYAISKFDDNLTPFSADNKQIGSPDRDGDVESGYEAIFHHEGLFYVVRESVLHHHHGDDDDTITDKGDKAMKADKNHSFHAIVEELLLGEDDYTVQSECMCEFEFEGTSKGFEGAIGFPDTNGELYILGLCEGNHCSEERKEDAGHGRIVMMKKSMLPDPSIPGGCLWETVRVIHIPKSAEFIDYSDIDISADGRVAITSQENSAVWIGAVVGIDNGIINPDSFEFVDNSGVIYQFPKSNDCHTIYCNVEGIHWMNNEMLLGVSDKMKGKGKQDYRCFDKDQSIHAFVPP